jgi:CRP/FNR family transcriptional activator FtrB
MDPQVLRNLTRGALLRRFPERLIVTQEGDPAEFLHVVIEGSVQLFSGRAEREASLYIARPFSTFALAEVVHDGAYLNSARTLERSLILMISARKVRKLSSIEPSFAIILLHELAARHEEVVKALKDMKLSSCLERLANWLILTNAAAGATGQFQIPFNKRMLATQLGMTPENLSRNFAALRAYGVKVSAREVTLKDVALLGRLARWLNCTSGSLSK